MNLLSQSLFMAELLVRYAYEVQSKVNQSFIAEEIIFQNVLSLKLCKIGQQISFLMKFLFKYFFSKTYFPPK